MVRDPLSSLSALSEPEAADIGTSNERLKAGLDAIEDEVLQTYGMVLPLVLVYGDVGPFDPSTTRRVLLGGPTT